MAGICGTHLDPAIVITPVSGSCCRRHPGWDLATTGAHARFELATPGSSACASISQPGAPHSGKHGPTTGSCGEEHRPAQGRRLRKEPLLALPEHDWYLVEEG